MRPRSVVTTVAALTVGLTAATALHRRASRRLPVPALGAAPAAEPVHAEPSRAELAPAAPAAPVTDGVVLPFVRPVDAAPAQQEQAAPARCGDSGGVTKAGAPCAARATTGGRCRHHPLAA